jgi:hypothetical protein
MQNDLEKIAGIDNKIILAGKELSLKPLRIREMIEMERYTTEHGDISFSSIEMRAYGLFLALRHNEGITHDFILDQAPSGVVEAYNKLDKLSFPSQIVTEVSGNH